MRQLQRSWAPAPRLNLRLGVAGQEQAARFRGQGQVLRQHDLQRHGLRLNRQPTTMRKLLPAL